MTRDQLIERLKSQRAKKITLTWNQFVTAFQALPADQKASFLSALNLLEFKVANQVLEKVVKDTKKSLATTEVDAIVADNTITIDELLEILD